MKSIFINGALIVNDGQARKGSVLIEDERIASVTYGDSCTAPEGAWTIDAEGMVLMPGAIDDQVHFREPGNTRKADIASESAAALAGGVTSFMDMPNNNPPTCSMEALESKCASAAENSRINYAFYLGASNGNLEEILNADPSLYCGIKVFMGSSTGNMLVDDPRTLEGIFRNVKKVVATHCEEESIIRANMQKAKEAFPEGIPFRMHPAIRSREACIASSAKALELAVKYGTKLHILHVSTADEIRMIEKAREMNPGISGEICVHYLYFDDSMYDRYGSRMKCNPAIKTAEDRKALLEAVRKGSIRVVATDHAPHLAEEKDNPYTEAPSGLPLVGHSLLMMLELASSRALDDDIIKGYTIVADRMCHGPAERFSVKERGYIRKGYYADLVLFRPDRQYRPEILYRCGWSPVQDMTFSNRIEKVFVNGELGFDSGKLNGGIRGRRLEFIL